MRMAAAGAKFKESIGRIPAATAGIDPHVGLFAGAFALILKADRTFVDEDHPTGKNPGFHRFVQGSEPRTEAQHPVRKGLATDVDIAASQHLRLPVERQVIGVLGR